MKIKTTTKQLKEFYGVKNAINISAFCQLRNLLDVAGVYPFAYTAGVYGWNFDAYDLDGVLLIYGDRGGFGKVAAYDDKIENKAREMVQKYGYKLRKNKRCLNFIKKFIQSQFTK